METAVAEQVSAAAEQEQATEAVYSALFTSTKAISQLQEEAETIQIQAQQQALAEAVEAQTETEEVQTMDG